MSASENGIQLDVSAMPSALEAHLAGMAKAMRVAGLPDETIAAVLAEYAKAMPLAALDRGPICGNVDKATKLACARAPHPDKPGQREEHAAENHKGTIVRWRSQPTIAEQLADETAAKGPRCGARSEKVAGAVVTCERAPHRADRPHAGTHPSAAVGLMTW